MAEETVDSLCQQARQAVARREIAEAGAFYQRALDLKADSSDAHYGMGTISFMLKDFPAAIRHFELVLETDPKRAAAYVNLGAIHNRLGEHDKAIDLLRRGIQYDPRRAEAYYNLGLVYRAKRDTKHAVQAYREAIRLAPRMADAHLNLANILLERGEPGAAHPHYQSALELKPDWKPAMAGLSRTEDLLRAATPQVVPVVPAVTSANAWESPGDPSEKERQLDPDKHGDALARLHKRAIDTEGKGTQFIQTLTGEIEPTIRQLSSCLLMHGGLALALDLETCLQRLDDALETLSELQTGMVGNLDKIREQGNQLIRN